MHLNDEEGRGGVAVAVSGFRTADPMAVLSIVPSYDIYPNHPNDPIPTPRQPSMWTR